MHVRISICVHLRTGYAYTYAYPKTDTYTCTCACARARVCVCVCACARASTEREGGVNVHPPIRPSPSGRVGLLLEHRRLSGARVPDTKSKNLTRERATLTYITV